MTALSNATMYSLHMCTDPFSYNKNPVNTSLQPVIRKQAEGGSKSHSGEQPKEKDLLDWLLQAGLAPVVTEILLLLDDPPSLHSAKQVCQLWCNYIQSEVWGRAKVRLKLRQRHLDRWESGDGSEKQWELGEGSGLVFSICCDDYWLVVGLTNGLSKIFQIATGKLIAALDCKGAVECGVRGDLGDKILATATTTGMLCLWDKKKLTLEQRQQLGGGGAQSIKVLKDRLLVAVSEYILVLDHSCQELMRLKQYGSGALSCVTSDGHWVVAGAARGLLLWDLHSGDCVRTIRQGSFPNLVLDYPHCWALGSGGRGAVWDLSAGKIVSYFGSNDRRFWELTSNGRFLAASEANYKLRKFARVPGPFPPLTVTLMDTRSMKAGEEGPTWERVLELPTSLAIPGTEYCCSTVNSTCLVVAQCKTIFVWKFYEGP